MASQSFTLEVLMAAYNNEVATRLAMEGYLRQVDTDFVLVVADDGSGPGIAALVEEYRQKGLHIRHVWQEDRGYRRAMILNRAIASSEADYLVFVDNDCIPQSTFVADHRRGAMRGHFTAARRVDLGPELSDEVRAGRLPIAQIEQRGWLLRMAAQRRLRHGEYGLRLPWWLTNLWRRKRKGLLGANMAAWREDLLRVNGFDSATPEWCGEESDLEWRLEATGVKPGALIGRGAVAHLYHQVRSGYNPEAEQYLFDKKARNETYAANGIKEVAEAR